MDEAITFITEVIGGELLFRGGGPFAFDEGNWMTENLEVHPRAVLEEYFTK